MEASPDGERTKACFAPIHLSSNAAWVSASPGTVRENGSPAAFHMVSACPSGEVDRKETMDPSREKAGWLFEFGVASGGSRYEDLAVSTE